MITTNSPVFGSRWVKTGLFFDIFSVLCCWCWHKHVHPFSVALSVTKQTTYATACTWLQGRWVICNCPFYVYLLLVLGGVHALFMVCFVVAVFWLQLPHVLVWRPLVVCANLVKDLFQIWLQEKIDEKVKVKILFKIKIWALLHQGVLARTQLSYKSHTLRDTVG